MLGVILFAHGSRDPLWHRPVEAVAARMQALAPGVPVRCAYLEISTPDLPTAAAAMVAEGATTVRIVPLFLGTGRHAREDLPVLVTALRAQHPDTLFDLQPAVGEDPQVIALLARLALGGSAFGQ